MRCSGSVSEPIVLKQLYTNPRTLQEPDLLLNTIVCISPLGAGPSGAGTDASTPTSNSEPDSQPQSESLTLLTFRRGDR